MEIDPVCIASDLPMGAIFLELRAVKYRSLEQAEPIHDVKKLFLHFP